MLLLSPAPIMPLCCWNVKAFKYSRWMGHMSWAGQSPAPILKLSRVTEGRESPRDQEGQEDQEDLKNQENQVRTSAAGRDRSVSQCA